MKGCADSCQEANHAAGMQGANFCPEFPDRGRKEQTEEAEVKPITWSLMGWAGLSVGVIPAMEVRRVAGRAEAWRVKVEKVFPAAWRAWVSSPWSVHEGPSCARLGRGVSQPTAPHPMCLISRLDFEEQLEDLMGQHKDLWEFHVSHSATPSTFRISPGSTRPQTNGILQASFLSTSTPSSVQTLAAVQHPHCHLLLTSSPDLPTHPWCSPSILKWSWGTPMNQGGLTQKWDPYMYLGPSQTQGRHLGIPNKKIGRENDCPDGRAQWGHMMVRGGAALLGGNLLSKEKPWFVLFAGSPVVNTHSRADFKPCLIPEYSWPHEPLQHSTAP